MYTDAVKTLGKEREIEVKDVTRLETHGLVLDECSELGLPCIVCEQRSRRASLPPPPPDVPAHCDELEAVYLAAVAAARAGERPRAAPVSAQRRIIFLLHQRESALATIDPGGRLP